jgi:hypothetical protein
MNLKTAVRGDKAGRKQVLPPSSTDFEDLLTAKFKGLREAVVHGSDMHFSSMRRRRSQSWAFLPVQYIDSVKPITSGVRHSGARPKAASPESVIPAGGYGFRARRHGASKTRVNALAAAPRNDGYDSNLRSAVAGAVQIIAAKTFSTASMVLW